MKNGFKRFKTMYALKKGYFICGFSKAGYDSFFAWFQ